MSPLLGTLLRAVYDELIRQPPNLPALKGALGDLLTFLCGKDGRTHANCVETDRFFFTHHDWPASWEHLPEPWTDVLGDIGGLLHDAIAAPAIAENFDSLPEQLLQRVQALEIPRGAV
ncbi:MAG: hypothetical protein FJ253_05515 [Phycisphaerae bacterium]|nr:hypothetical protein [Phycisphaerae bacterium]